MSIINFSFTDYEDLFSYYIFNDIINKETLAALGARRADDRLTRSPTLTLSDYYDIIYNLSITIINDSIIKQPYKIFNIVLASFYLNTNYYITGINNYETDCEIQDNLLKLMLLILLLHLVMVLLEPIPLHSHLI